MQKCHYCGKPIRFFNHKGKLIIVNDSVKYFVPGKGGEIFITAKGDRVRGEPAPDGRMGYKEHYCD